MFFVSHEFSHSNQILLSLFGILNVFHDSILVVYTVWHIFGSVLATKHVENVK